MRVCIHSYTFLRAITKNGYTRSVWSQKRVQAGIKSKIHSTSRAIGQNKSYPFFRDYDPGTTVNGYYARSLGRLSTVSEYLLLRVFVLYLVVYAFGRYFLLVLGLYLLFKFFTTSFISLYSYAHAFFALVCSMKETTIFVLYHRVCFNF